MLVEALIREGGQWGLDEVTELGAIAGGAQAQRWGELANRNRPILHTHDRYGHRIDEIEFDPAYHELMRTAIGHGMHAAPWADHRPGAHVVRAAKMLVWTPEPGHVCPISATYAVVPSLRYNADLANVYEPLLTSRQYDPELKPATTKVGHHRDHVDDREAGRLGCAGRHHPGHTQRRRQLHPGRSQVVHLGDDVGHRPGVGPGPGRVVVLPAAAGAARRQPKPDVPAAAEGQARQSRQRVQ